MAVGPSNYKILRALTALRKFKKTATGPARIKVQNLIQQAHDLLNRFEDERHTNTPLFKKKYEFLLEETKELLKRPE